LKIGVAVTNTHTYIYMYLHTHTHTHTHTYVPFFWHFVLMKGCNGRLLEKQKHWSY